ncbi:MAG: sugar ABC transporter substrate-binding protein [Bilifractor sp.]|jgi:ribose transport system substrate-binding protein
MKKKVVAALISGLMALSLVACGGSSSSSSSTSSSSSSSSSSTASSTTASSSGSESVTTTTSTSGATASTSGDLLAEDYDGSDVKVGFVVKSLADQYWILMKAGAEQAADKYGCDLTFIAPNAESDVQKQVENIETLTSSGVDVICVAPSNDETVLPALQNAVNAGIKIIAVDTDSSLEDKLSFIGTGNEEAAKVGAEWAGEQVGEGAKAIILRGRLGDATHDARQKGLEEGLEEKGVEVLETQAADSTEEKGMQVAENLIQKYDDVDLIITTADSMATGAYNAVQSANKTDIKIMGFDGTLPVAEKVAEGGQMIGTTAQNPYNMGILGVQNAIKAAHGETIEKVINSGQTVVTKDNAADFVADLKAKVGES